MYDHTQPGRFQYLLLPVALAMGVGALFLRPESTLASWILGGTASLLALVALGLARLRVHDAGGALRVRFGPLPLFRRSIPWGRIRAAAPTRTHLGHGFGVRWLPGGWLYNVWGFDAVELTLDQGRVLVGTDEPEELTDYVRRRLRAGGDTEPGSSSHS